MTVILPEEIAKASRPTLSSTSDVSYSTMFSTPSTSPSCHPSVEKGAVSLCDALSAHYDAPASSIYSRHRANHAFAGTVFVSLVDEAYRLLPNREFAALREELRALRDVEPLMWEMASHVGRPRVPMHVLPIFAAHAAEKKAGCRIPSLTFSQATDLC